MSRSGEASGTVAEDVARGEKKNTHLLPFPKMYGDDQQIKHKDSSVNFNHNHYSGSASGHLLSHSSRQPCEKGAVVIPTLQRRKLRPRTLQASCRSSRQQSRAWSPGLPATLPPKCAWVAPVCSSHRLSTGGDARVCGPPPHSE